MSPELSDSARPLRRAVLMVAAALLGAVVLLGWPDLVFALALEDAPLAGLQTALLVACATTAALLASLAPASAGRGWGLLALGLLAAALDDRFMGHERAQQLLLDHTGPGPFWQAVAHGLLLVLVPLGLLALVWLRQQMRPAAWRWCAWGVAVGCGALALDARFDAAGPQVLEELGEYAAETLFLCGLLTEARSRASPMH